LPRQQYNIIRHASAAFVATECRAVEIILGYFNLVMMNNPTIRICFVAAAVLFAACEMNCR
jgi:hypothetical protein